MRIDEKFSGDIIITTQRIALASIGGRDYFHYNIPKRYRRYLE